MKVSRLLTTWAPAVDYHHLETICIEASTTEPTGISRTTSPTRKLLVITTFRYYWGRALMFPISEEGIHLPTMICRWIITKMHPSDSLITRTTLWPAPTIPTVTSTITSIS